MVAPDTFVPLTFHWYDGDDPPLVGVAVNVTCVPAQTGFAEGEMDMLTGMFGFTVIVTVLEVAGLPAAQAALEVNTQVTASLLAGI